MTTNEPTQAGATTNGAGFRHIPALDGVRGIAILLVMVYHVVQLPIDGRWGEAVNHVLKSGWLGVDLFFALSGFLITSILLHSKGKPNYFHNFYVRRALRIFPLYYLFLVLVFWVLPALTSRPEWQEPAQHQGWFWLYLSNVFFAIEGWKWGALSPTWSLAIEEQFYLIWPAVVLLLSRRGLLRCCIVLTLVSLAGRCVGLAVGMNEVAVYTLTPLRLEGLALGALAAIVLFERPAWFDTFRRRCRLTVVSGTALIAGYVFVVGVEKDDPVAQTLGYTFASLVFAAFVVVMATADPNHTFTRMLSRGPLVKFGQLSYALYLIHRPIESACRIGIERVAGDQPLGGSDLAESLIRAAVVFAASLLVAQLSWTLMESQVLKLKGRFTYENKPDQTSAVAEPILNRPTTNAPS